MTERFEVVGAEDGAERYGYIQDMVALDEGEGTNTWGWAGVEIPGPRWVGPEVLSGTLLKEGEQAIVVTCRADDRAALLPYLAAALNIWHETQGEALPGVTVVGPIGVGDAIAAVGDDARAIYGRAAFALVGEETDAAGRTWFVGESRADDDEGEARRVAFRFDWLVELVGAGEVAHHRTTYVGE